MTKKIVLQLHRWLGLISGLVVFIKSSGEQLRNMNIDMHTGSISGIAGKLLACLCSLIAASLPVTGRYIWLGKTRKHKRLVVNPKGTLAVS